MEPQRGRGTLCELPHLLHFQLRAWCRVGVLVTEWGQSAGCQWAVVSQKEVERVTKTDAQPGGAVMLNINVVLDF